MSSLEGFENNLEKKISKRKFLGLLGGTAIGAVIFEACGIPEQEFIIQSPVDMPEDYVKGEDNWFATSSDTSDYGESIIVRVMQGRAKKIEGNPDFPNTLGKHRAVSETELQTFYHPDRIAGPLLRKTSSGNHRPITWQEGISLLTDGLKSKGRKTVVTKPLRGLNKGIVEKFVKEVDGTHLTLSSLRDNALYETSKMVFGTTSLPYFDIKNADLIVSFGLDFIGNWGPVEYVNQFGKFRSNDHRGYLYQIEPRMSLTAANADQWLCPDLGKEGLIALMIADQLIKSPKTSTKHIEEFKTLAGISEIGELNNATNVALDPQSVADATGISSKKLESLISRIITSLPESSGPGKKIMFLSGGTSSGYSNSNSLNSLVLGLNYLTGSVNEEGGIILNPDDLFQKVQISEEFINFSSSSTWSSQSEWNKEIETWKSGGQDLMIVNSVDFINEIPGISETIEAIGKVKLSVGFGTIMNDTLERCDLILPIKTSLQSWGIDIPEPKTTYQSVTFQQPVASDPVSRDGLKKLSDAKNFYDVLLQQMDNSLKEVAYIDICRNLADKIFASSVSKDSSIIASNSDDFFKGILARGGWWNVNKKSAPRKNAKIRVINAVSNVTKSAEDFHLIPFKSHVFGDGNALSTPWAQASPDPITSITWDSWVEINTRTAERLKIKQGDIIKVSSKHGQIELPAYLHPAVPFESVAIPIGQGKNFSGRYSENRGANVVDIIGKSSLNENDDIPWCTTSVKLQKTGRKKKVSKFEGSVPAISVEPGVPIMTLGSGESAEEGYHRYHKEHLEHTFGDNFKNDKKEEK